jgi:hypothetical protein
MRPPKLKSKKKKRLKNRKDTEYLRIVWQLQKIQHSHRSMIPEGEEEKQRNKDKFEATMT